MREKRDLNIDTSREEEIPVRNFVESIDFTKIQVGAKVLDDALVNMGALTKLNSRLASKDQVLKAMENCDYESMREISTFFYRTSGIYSRLCRYMAYFYRYDWLVTPMIIDEGEKNQKKALEDFHNVLYKLDTFDIKSFLGDVSLKVIRFGCYYGYIVNNPGGLAIQELDPAYCRSRFSVNGRPAIEFDMDYFDAAYKDTTQKMAVLNLYPEEFKKGYMLYKQGKLPAAFQGDKKSWYLLEVDNAIKFNINGDDAPLMMSVIPAIIDLDTAQELDFKRMAQKLLKIVIQKMPLDKNGELIFDVEEAGMLHNNAVRMLSKAIGIDVLTTFAEVEVADMSDSSSTSSIDELEKMERSVYNEAGISQMQFNTDGNLALEKSILNDEATLYNLIKQYEKFVNHLLLEFNKKPKKYYFRAQILSTTIYNYQDMAKLYKEQTQLGYSKMLPQIALGQAQSTVLANAFFENDVLDLVNVFIPPMMSSTMSADAIATINENRKNGTTGAEDTGSTGGRPAAADDEKSEKTIANQESMG